MKIKIALVILVVVLATLFFSGQVKINIEIPVLKKYSKTAVSEKVKSSSDEELVKISKTVLPQSGVELPIKWRDFSKQLIDNGVIDREKFEDLYKKRDEFDDEIKRLIENTSDSKIVMNENNANVLLNLFWAFGLANKNTILETGSMTNPAYGGVGNFASTGGWDLAKGKAMDHYSKYEFIKLTSEQQALVESIAKSIYRPCCDNPTDFPDCNHGMAMLGLLELMAANGTSEEQMYKVALWVNSYWFPGYYPVVAQYFQSQNTSWDKVDPKEVLGAKYSSASGYKRIEAIVSPSSSSNGSNCGT